MVTHHNRLPVAFGVEGVAGSGEFLAQLDVVVNLTVERQCVALRVIRGAPAKRLVGVLDVDDGQAVEAEDGVFVVPGACGVRAAVVHARQGVPDRINELGCVCVRGKQGKKATHIETSPYIQGAPPQAAKSPLNNRVLAADSVNRRRQTFAVPHKGANLWMNFLPHMRRRRSYRVAKQLLIDDPPVSTATRSAGIQTVHAR